MTTQRVWLVTGASSGFGLSLTTYVLEQGDIVIATLRKPETLKHLLETWTEGQLLILKVDVSNPDDIKDAFRTAEIRFGRIDVVYSNAGMSVMGELESTPEEEARKMFDVNFWGAINVAREAVRFFRDVNKPQGGRLWSVTSGAGLLPIPAFGYYCASKFAHEGAISTLAAEVDPKWNIKITLLEYGAFRTRSTSSESMIGSPPHPAYADPSTPSSKSRVWAKGDSHIGDADKAVKMLYSKLLTDPNPPLQLPLGHGLIPRLLDQWKKHIENLERTASWSDDLEIDGRSW